MPATVQSKLCLESLPPELVHRIGEYLDLESIRNLRLVCKVVCNSLYGQRFRHFFAIQKTDLTSRSLTRLGQIADHPKLGSAVQTLIVLAVVYDTSELDRMLRTKRRRIHEQQGVFSMTTEPEATDEELYEAGENRQRLLALIQEQEIMRQDESDEQLLAGALRSLGQLHSLAIEAAVVQDLGGYAAASSVFDWHPIWIRAAQVYRTVTQAVARSSVIVNALHIYTSSKRCSVPTWDVNDHMPALQSANFARAADSIKSISLSVSTKVETNYQKIVEARANLLGADRAYYEAGMGTRAGLLSENDPSAVAEENYPGVARLLKQMPNLERLDLHLYNTLQAPANNYSKVVFLYDQRARPTVPTALHTLWSVL